MLGWFKRTAASDTGIAPALKVDLHSHLIPGIDDGAKTLEESLALIRRMVDLGYAKLILTPHVMRDAYHNTPETIIDGLERLREAVREAEIDVVLEASAEYYLDEGFLPLLEAGKILPIAGKYLLFETSYLAHPNNLLDMIYAIKLHGYSPILAHPERYRYIKDPQQEYGELKELEVLFQIDTTSLGGYYGKDAKKKAEFLLKEGWIDFVGSDAHRMRHLDQLDAVLHTPKIWTKMLSRNTLRNNTLV